MSDQHPLRILFLSHEFPPTGGGAATALDHLSRALACQGHAIGIITIGIGRGDEHETDPFGRLIIRLGARRRSLLAPSATELFRSYLALRFRSAQYAEGFRPDVLVAFFTFPAGRAALHLRHKIKVPLMVSLRGSDVPGFSPTRWGLLQRIQPTIVRPVWKSADLLSANGERLVQLARRFNPSREVLNLPNGVDTQMFFPAPTPPQKPPLKILCVGQLISRKRCLELLAGFQWALTQGLDAELTFVGDGPLRTALQRAASNPALASRVRISGLVPRSNLPDLYRQHHVLAHLSSAEGISNVVLEALASGLTVIGTSSAQVAQSSPSEPHILLNNVEPKTVGGAFLEHAYRVPQNEPSSPLPTHTLSWEDAAHTFCNTLNDLLAHSEPTHTPNPAGQ